MLPDEIAAEFPDEKPVMFTKRPISNLSYFLNTKVIPDKIVSSLCNSGHVNAVCNDPVALEKWIISRGGREEAEPDLELNSRIGETTTYQGRTEIREYSFSFSISRENVDIWSWNHQITKVREY